MKTEKIKVLSSVDTRVKLIESCLKCFKQSRQIVLCTIMYVCLNSSRKHVPKAYSHTKYKNQIRKSAHKTLKQHDCTRAMQTHWENNSSDNNEIF